METSVGVTQNSNLELSKRMILWIFIITIIMLFGAWTSAYIVSRSEGRWLEFAMPTTMLWSTIVIVISSIPMHFAYQFAKKNNLERIKIALISTLSLGVLFIILQFISFNELISNNIYFTGKSSKVSGSFLYILTIIHVLHIVAGIVFLLITLFASVKNRINSSNLLGIELCTTFWHFLGGLWVFLYVFLTILR